MKILLASLSIEPDCRFENNPNAPYPIGLAYIHSVLELEGHEVKLLFLNNFDNDYSEEAFFSAVKEWRPQLVGFQIFSMNRTSTFAAIEKLESTYPDIKVIIGGIHTSVMYEQILLKYDRTIAIIGEGELTFSEVVKAIESGHSFENIDGLAFNKEGNVFVTKPRELLKDLDILPFPKHDIFFDNDPERKVGHIIASRGCPFDCSFCCLKVISLRKYRPRNIQKVVEEIVALKKQYPRLSQIQFHDDTLLLDNKRVIEFCKEIISRQLWLVFICSARVKPVSAEMFYWMERAGFVKIMFGLETASLKLLDSIHKNITPSDVINLFETIRKFDFNITTFLMCGFPGETDETVQETIDLVKKTQKIHYNLIAGIGKLWVYPGTDVFQIMKNRGKITDDYWMTGKPVPYFTVEHDMESLIKFEEKMMDELSFFRIFTLRGFIHHFMSMPIVIIRFILKKNNRSIVLDAIKTSIWKHFPQQYPMLITTYRKYIKRAA